MLSASDFLSPSGAPLRGVRTSEATHDAEVGDFVRMAAAGVVTLPPAAEVYAGAFVAVGDDAGTADVSPITVSPNAGQTIDGAASFSLAVADGVAGFCYFGGGLWRRVTVPRVVYDPVLGVALPVTDAASLAAPPGEVLRGSALVLGGGPATNTIADLEIEDTIAAGAVAVATPTVIRSWDVSTAGSYVAIRAIVTGVDATVANVAEWEIKAGAKNVAGVVTLEHDTVTDVTGTGHTMVLQVNGTAVELVAILWTGMMVHVHDLTHLGIP